MEKAQLGGWSHFKVFLSTNIKVSIEIMPDHMQQDFDQKLYRKGTTDKTADLEDCTSG